MEDIFENSFPAAAGNEMQDYMEAVSRQYQLMDQIMQSIREGNEYQALRAVRVRSEIRISGCLEDAVSECRFDLIWMQALMTWALRRTGAEDFYLDRLNTAYMRKIYQISNTEEYNRLAEEMVKDYCGLNRLKDFCNHSLLIQKIIIVVDLDLKKPLTLHYFADTLNVNRSYLSDLFKREMGVTITEYVTEKRISHAANLLAVTQQPIKTVAEQVGIADVHYFSRLFKRRMGQTPRQYRESRRGAAD